MCPADRIELSALINALVHFAVAKRNMSDDNARDAVGSPVGGSWNHRYRERNDKLMIIDRFAKRSRDEITRVSFG